MHNPVTSQEQAQEQARLDALESLDVLDTPAEPRFDRFTRLAARTFGVPIALMSMVDSQRQWFKSRCGLDVQQTPRAVAFCSSVVEQGAMMVIEDAASDPRFAANPLVTGAPHIRFYAGHPLFCDGQAVGTLCIIDRVPRRFDAAQRQVLADLADLAEVELNHAKTATARLMAEQALKALNRDLEQRVAARTAELERKLDELSQEVARRQEAEVSLQHSEDWNRTIVASSYSGFVGIDADGTVIEWNASAERIFGWPRAQAVGRGLAGLIVPPALRASHTAGLRRYLETGHGPVLNQKLELPALTASGAQITVEMTISTYEWRGQRCFGAFMNDISERIRTRQLLEEKQELLDAVLESIDVSIVACDAAGKLMLFNRAARALHGIDMKAVAPAEWPLHYSLYQADGSTPLALDDVPLMRALRGETVRNQAMVVAPAGSAPHTMLASGRPLRSAAGRPLGAVVAMKDVTELNASRDRAETNEARLRAITENLPALIGQVDAAGRFVFLNGHALREHGHGEELLGQELALAYRPEDYRRLAPWFERARAGERVSFEYVSTNGGREQHFQCSFVPQRAAGGQPDGFFAMAFDITERKLGELRLAESEERLRTITDNVPVLIAHLDGARRYAFANAVHQSWLGASPARILGKTMEEAFGAEHLAPQAEALARAWSGQASQCEHEIVRKKHTRIAHTTFLPQLRDGQVVGVYALTLDATASRMHERSLHALAHTDTLTGLPNRRHFEEALQHATRPGARGGRGAALLYLDVDHFKQINDRYGHAVGDAVLVEFARRLKASVRGSDLVARLAGDEFTVLLNDVAGEADLERVARKILAAMRAPFELEAVVLEVGTSVGAALAELVDASPSRLLDAADRALYKAKEAGRNTWAMQRLDRARGPAPAHA